MAAQPKSVPFSDRGICRDGHHICPPCVQCFLIAGWVRGSQVLQRQFGSTCRKSFASLLLMGFVLFRAGNLCSAEAEKPPFGDSNATEAVSQSFSEKFRPHIHTNFPTASSSTNGARHTHWELAWRGWDGLEMGVSRRTPLKAPREMLGLSPLSSNAPSLHLGTAQVEHHHRWSAGSRWCVL